MNADAIATIQPETVSQGLVRRLLEIKWALLAMVGQATEQCAGQRAQHDAERCCQVSVRPAPTACPSLE